MELLAFCQLTQLKSYTEADHQMLEIFLEAPLLEMERMALLRLSFSHLEWVNL